MSSAPFNRRALALIFGLGGVSLACALVLSIFTGDLGGRPETAGANGFSRSAIGHKGFIELLRQRDIPTVVSEHDTAGRAGPSSVLVIAEPSAVDDLHERLDDMLIEAGAALIVLPKWRGRPSADDLGWLEEVELRPLDDAQRVVDALGLQQTAVRRSPDRSHAWTSALGLAPTLLTPQLLNSDELEPLIASDDGILLGATHGYGIPVWILADPDLLANHGLLRGHNAALALAIIEHLRIGEHAVLVDETLHGFHNEPSIWRELFGFPLILPTTQALLTLLVLLWMATARFGKPVPPAPAIAPGKGFLIDNTAALLHGGGHGAHALRRYLTTTVRDVQRGLHLPPELTPSQVRHWLDRIAEARGLPWRLGELERDVADAAAARRGREQALIHTATRLYRWKQEMLHGSRHP